MTLLLLVMLTQPATASGQPLERQTALEKARNELAAGHREEAKRQLAAAADRFQSVEALLQLSRLQSAEGDAAGALGSLQRARALAPNSEDVLSAFAQVSLAAGAPVPAILALDALTRIYPTVAQHHYLLGVALMRAGDMPAAVESLRTAERLESDRGLTLLALGIALTNMQSYDDALPFLARSIELEPENVDAVAALGEAEEGSGDLESAATHVERVLARSPGHATANLVAGLLEMQRGRYAEARTALERAIAADPLSPKAYYQLSLACTRLGDTAAAQQYLDAYRKALRDVEKRVNDLRASSGPPRIQGRDR